MKSEVTLILLVYEISRIETPGTKVIKKIFFFFFFVAWDIVSLVLNMDFSLGHIRGRQYRAVSVGRTGGTSGLIWEPVKSGLKLYV